MKLLVKQLRPKNKDGSFCYNKTMSKQSRGDKGEALVKECLESMSGYHQIINDFTYFNKRSEMSHQIDHIFIHPHGVFVIETKAYYGKIISDTHDSFWIKEVNGEQVKIANPLKQNKSHAFIILKILKGKYDVIPVVVFTHNNAPYMDDNVINLNDLPLFIESYPFKKKLSKKQIDGAYKSITNRSSDISKEEHVENISYLKQIKKEIRDEMSYAIENNKCPRCGHPFVHRGYNFFCSYCDFKFKL